jgi:hypothetical protein
MGDRIRMTKHHLKVRGAMVAACAGLATTLWACSDSSTPVDDGGGNDGPAAMDSTSHDAPSTETASNDSASNDVTVNDAPANDGATDAKKDVASNDAPSDTSSDSTLTDSASDAGGDVASEAAVDSGPDAVAPAPLQMCLMLDGDWGILPPDGGEPSGCATQTGTTCPDRVSAWGNNFMLDYLTGALNTDCRISSGFLGWSMNDLNQYQADVTDFALSLFGCPLSGLEAGPYAFSLIPQQLASHQWTSADLKLLSDLYVAAVQVAITSDQGLPDLTTQQYADINAQLAYLASQVPGVLQSSAYSFNMCPADAGSDAPQDASSDGPGGG